MVIFFLCIGLIIGCIGFYLYIRPKLKITAQKNVQILEENHKLELEHKEILQEKQEISEEFEKAKLIYQDLKDKVSNEKFQYQTLNDKIIETKNNLLNLKEVQEKTAKDYYTQALKIAENSYEKEIDRISDDLFQKREEAKKFYLQTVEECFQQYQKTISAKQLELKELEEELKKQQEKVSTAVEAARRKLEMEQKQDFYRIQVSETDILEIKRLREVLPYLRDKTPLNKVIYKVYYERPLTDMIGRVVGPGTHSGIYKITNLQNQMCYVGQTTDFATRFKQHVKRGVGAEDWTQNKLYPAMYAIGVENFSFEIIEECARDQLNEKEKYWTSYFQAQDFGYSIRSG